MKKFLSIAMLACAVSFAEAAVDAKPLRLGPVSVYGALGTSGKKIVSQKTGQQVMLRGMSLFWSDATGTPYYNSEVIGWAADRLGIDVFRFAMGIDCYNSDGGGCTKDDTKSGAIASNVAYKYNPTGKEAQLDNMVKAAIENDIYIIVDWHSHRAENEQSLATDFFSRMSAKYKDVPNIIWEVYNEPVNTSSGTIASYANTVISAIRKNSPNLALVGTPSWSQMGSGSCGTVNQSNVGYVFHFYAATHSLNSFKGNIENCNGAVFITEWGTTEASGAGSVSSGSTNEWTAYMDEKQIPNCNWSLRHETVGDKNEASAMFAGSKVLNSKAALDAASYSTSGSLVKSYLTKHKNDRNWAELLVAGKNTGSCAFKAVTASELDGSVTGKVSSSCTYTSSDPTVATVEAGTVKINGAGYAVMTGNDNSQSVVMVTAVPSQTFGQTDVVCRLGGGGSCSNYSGQAASTKLEYLMKVSRKTVEGAEITYESDNPDVVSVAKATCSSNECYGDNKNQQVWIATFKSLGSAKIHATAKAIAGFRAIDTTFTFSLKKAEQGLDPKYFGNKTVEKNSMTQVFSLKARGGAIPSYTILPEGYAEQQGDKLVAGDKDATIIIKGEVSETEQYEGFVGYITVTIGAGSAETEAQAKKAFGLDGTDYIVPQTRKNLATNAYMRGNQLVVDVKRSGFVNIQVLDVAGRNIARNASRFMSAGTNTVDFSDMAKGLYIVTVKSSSAMKTIRWGNK